MGLGGIEPPTSALSVLTRYFSAAFGDAFPQVRLGVRPHATDSDRRRPRDKAGWKLSKDSSVWRGRMWIKTSVDRSRLPPHELGVDRFGGQHLVALSSIEDDARGQDGRSCGHLAIGVSPAARKVKWDAQASCQPMAQLVDERAGSPTAEQVE